MNMKQFNFEASGYRCQLTVDLDIAKNGNGLDGYEMQWFPEEPSFLPKGFEGPCGYEAFISTVYQGVADGTGNPIVGNMPSGAILVFHPFQPNPHLC